MMEEVERMITELAALCNEGNVLAITRPPAPAATTVPPKKLLLTAKLMRAHSEYCGPDSKHLLIIPEDTIIVYAYITDVIAVGFNTRTCLGGRFPINIMSLQPLSYVKPEILLAKKNCSGDVLYLAYKSGQYVRVYRREIVGGNWAYGFNQSTLSMGRINTLYDFDKVEWSDMTKS
jgi:hypothetical protein